MAYNNNLDPNAPPPSATPFDGESKNAYVDRMINLVILGRPPLILRRSRSETVHSGAEADKIAYGNHYDTYMRQHPAARPEQAGGRRSYRKKRNTRRKHKSHRRRRN